MGTAGLEKLEVDTAASHSILTHEAYKRLKNMPYGNIPNMRPETRKIELADGSSSNKELGSVSIRCQAGNSDSRKLDFYVMKAQGNLLGRHAIEMLWPEMFRGFRAAVASTPTVKKVRNVTEVPEVKVPVKKINPVIKVKECSNTVSVGVCAIPEKALSGSSDGSSSVHARESSDDTGNTTALSEKLKPELPEMRTLTPLPEGTLTKDVSETGCEQICDLCPEVFNEEKGEF